MGQIQNTQQDATFQPNHVNITLSINGLNTLVKRQMSEFFEKTRINYMMPAKSALHIYKDTNR